MPHKFFKLSISIFLLIVAVLFTNVFNGYCDDRPQLPQSTDKELTNYYARKLQRPNPDFLKSKMLFPKGDFLQPWMASDWKYEDYTLYLKEIKAAGMEYVVLQYVAEAEVINGKARLTENYFHLDDDEKKNPYMPSVYSKCVDDDDMVVSQFDVVDNLFLAAKEVGIKVFLGTVLNDQWWDDDFRNNHWRAEILALERLLISYFTTKYKTIENSSDTFYGIYYTHEMYGNMDGHEKYWNEMLRNIREFVYSRNPSLKFMASLYCSDHDLFDSSDKETIEDKMQKFVFDLLTNHGRPILRNGDIVSVQDKLSTHPTTSVEYNAKFLYAVRNALKVLATDYNNPLYYWITVENMTSDLAPAPIERYARQLLICSQLADSLMIFSYAHYYMPKDKSNRPIKELSQAMKNDE